MKRLKNCVYCGKPILEISKEHVIQNAIGGLYESEDICCKDCNNYISKYIDAPFTEIFNPIIGKIKNFAKTHNKNSTPSYKGKAVYNNEVYDVVIKKEKVIACPELSKKLKTDISQELKKFKILQYYFDIDNIYFKKGISKIAFNFAIDKGVSIDILKKGIDIQKSNGKIKGISFNYPVIPFVPLNATDAYIELNTEIELYHNLILFSQENILWCYVDLFNTFQFYVLLSYEFNGNIPINESYLQFVQKEDRTIPEIDIKGYKDIYIYSSQYGIEPSIDLEVFKKRIEESIRKKSIKKSMVDVISSKLVHEYSEYIIENELYEEITNLRLYFDEDDKLNEDTFRKITFDIEMSEYVSYPEQILNLIHNDEIDVNSYTFKKFKRLKDFLNK